MIIRRVELQDYQQCNALNRTMRVLGGGINTLTSVAKDNMILEIMEDDDNEQTV